MNLLSVTTSRRISSPTTGHLSPPVADAPGSPLHAPCQRLVEPTPELEVIGGVDNAVTVEIEKRLVAAAGGLVEGAAEGEVVGGIEDGREIGSRRAARRSGRGAGVAEKTVER